MRIHILAISGQGMTTPLALALKKIGHIVSGSDQEKIYPPASTQLEQAGITLNQPLGQIDLCIVGSGHDKFLRCREELEQIKRQGVPYISATQYIADNLIKENSIIVAGSYGKTTITAILAHTIPNTNYFFGGLSVNDKPSLCFSENNWSIIEGDESIHGLDTQAKFLYYKTKHVILTSANWEHKDCYPTEQDNLQAYQKLIEKIPPNGTLVYNPKDKNILKLLKHCRGKLIPYSEIAFDTNLIGQHNQENINAAYTLCRHLGFNFDISNFNGIKRRLEIIGTKKGILFIDDFAQSAQRVESALKAINDSYPKQRIVVYFEPHASFLQNKQSIHDFKSIQPYIYLFILGKLKISKDKVNRATASDWKMALSEKINYIPLEKNIPNFLQSQLKSGDILVHFSSGGLDGLNVLKSVYNNI